MLNGEEGGFGDVKWKIYVTDEKIKLIRKVLYSALKKYIGN